MSRDKQNNIKQELLDKLGLSDENGFEQAIIDLKKMLDAELNPEVEHFYLQF